MTLLFQPLDDRWFALVCSTAFGCWWMWMLLMSKHWAHRPLRQVPLLHVMWVLLLAVLWPAVMIAQFALGYDWDQFGSAPERNKTRFPATVTGQNRGESVQPHVAPREIAARPGALRGAMLVLVPALLIHAFGFYCVVRVFGAQR